MYIVNALVRSVQLFKVFGKRTNHILTVMRNSKQHLPEHPTLRKYRKTDKNY